MNGVATASLPDHGRAIDRPTQRFVRPSLRGGYRMERSDHPSVVVIGAGIVGSAIAMHLAERDLRPLLVDVDGDRAGHGASARSFASLSAFGADPVGYFELASAALASWSRWAERLGEVGFRRGGQLRWEASPAEGRQLAEQVERARSRGYPIVPIGEVELRRLLPAAEFGPVASASHAPRDGQVEPGLVVAACHAATQAAGGRLLLGEPARVRLDDHGIRVEVGDRILRPGVTVLAAGAESIAVARDVGLEIPTLASPGLLIETEPLPAFTDKVVYLPGGPGPRVFLRQRPDGSVVLGERSQETVAHDLSQQHASAVLRQAARFLPVLRGAHIAHTLLAWRSMPADRLPIVGPAPGIENLYLAVTHRGVTLAPALGRLVPQEIATGEPAFLLAPFRPARFAERATRVMLDVEDLFR
jgi:glycine/D-amino acid oxidase-like deaminating enzyme